MTIVLSVNGPEMLWMMADRRLSCSKQGNGYQPPPKDDARKIMSLRATDGVALIGYAGLGATALGTEPADWMGEVLQGLGRLSIEQSFSALADAVREHIPPHLVHLPPGADPSHTVIATAFVSGEPRLYLIELLISPDRKAYAFRKSRQVWPAPNGKNITPRTWTAGSGMGHLQRDKKLHMVNACDRGLIPPETVAEHLAKLNNEIRDGTADGSVGPRCIVAWVPRVGGVHDVNKIGMQTFTDGERDMNTSLDPSAWTWISMVDDGSHMEPVAQNPGKVRGPVYAGRRHIQYGAGEQGIGPTPARQRQETPVVASTQAVCSRPGRLSLTPKRVPRRDPRPWGSAAFAPASYAHFHWLYEDLGAPDYWARQGWDTAGALPAFGLPGRTPNNYVAYVADAREWQHAAFWNMPDLRILVARYGTLRFSLHLFLNVLLNDSVTNVFDQ